MAIREKVLLKKDIIKIHLIYWISFVVFFSLIWGSYDHQYGRNLMVQIMSLPARLILVYITLEILFPIFFAKEKYTQFVLAFILLLLFCSVFVQRFIVIFFIEGLYLPHNSEQFFHITHLANTTIDVSLAVIIPFNVKLFHFYNKSKKEINKLSEEKLNLENSQNKKFSIIKEGSVSHKIYHNDILFVESLKNYLRFKTKHKDLKSYGSISSLGESLNEPDFLRVHRSFIVNLDYLEAFSSKHLEIEGFEIPIGRKYKEEVKEKLKEQEFLKTS